MTAPACWALDVWVPGVPAPQGSKTGYAASTGTGAAKVYTGRVNMRESSRKVKPWRKQVHTLCRLEWNGRAPLDGPLVLDVEFVLPRLKATPASRPSGPHTVYPDLSKLVRSTEDAIKTAGVWADDARVVRTVSSKRRAELGEPTGARIRIATGRGRTGQGGASLPQDAPYSSLLTLSAPARALPPTTNPPNFVSAGQELRREIRS